MGASPAGSLDDARAVERARDGDHDAFRVLVERYQGRIHRVALRVLRDEEQARDAVQEAFLKAYGALRRFEGRSSFYTWMYRLTFNLCLDMKRRNRSDRHVEWKEEVHAEPDPGASRRGALGASAERDPEQDAERAQLGGQLAAAIRELPDDSRETLLLREVEGLSYAEIAEALGIPKGTVMSRLHYARRRVKESLLQAGVAPPEGGET